MTHDEKKFVRLISKIDRFGSYEVSARPRDLSKLDGIKLLLEELGNPQNYYKIIHIAGTNGKGTSAKIISSLLNANGFNTGCYTSPHLIDIRERITLNGKLIDKNDFTKSGSLILNIVKSYNGNPHISFFDLLTAIAFHCFMTARMDWAVIETGLGGLADSTNVTEKELCVLTKIGIDHQEVLGNSLREIALEKIGITKPNVPVVVSDQRIELKSWLIKHFKKSSVPYYFADEIFDRYFPKNNFSIESFSKPHIDCIKTSLCAMHILFKGSPPEKQNWLSIAKKVKMRGRLDLQHKVFWQKYEKSFNTILFDGAHNFDSLTALVEFISLKKLFHYTLILGMVSDKLNPLIRVPLTRLCEKADNIIFSPVPSPRSENPKSLESFVTKKKKFKHTPKIKYSSSVEQALQNALIYCDKPVVVAGSFYLIGKVLNILKRGNILK